MFIRKKKYDLLNREYLLLDDKYERLKCDHEEVWIENKEYKGKVLELENDNEAFRIEKINLEDRIKALNQEIDLYEKTLRELEEENKKLKKDNKLLLQANKFLNKTWNDMNRKLWVNRESKRQLRKFSEEVLNNSKIDRKYIASRLMDMSIYISTGFEVEMKIKEEK